MFDLKIQPVAVKVRGNELHIGWIYATEGTSS